MNERIKELKAKAMVCEDGVNWIIDEERFAELIVRECADLFKEKFAGEPFPRRIDSTIKNHFGIE